MRHVLYSMKRRVEDATLIHEHSSRSHLIVTLTVTAVSRQATMIPLSALATRVVLPDLQLTPPSSPNRQKSQRRSAPHSTTVSPLVSPPPSCNSSFADFSVFSSSSGKSGGESGVFRTKLQLVDLAGSECVGQLVLVLFSLLVIMTVVVRDVGRDGNGTARVVVYQSEFVRFG